MRRLLDKIGYVPSICVLELTTRCNMNCSHCGSSAGTARPDELTTDEFVSAIDQLAELGCSTLTISGGEALLRQDWDIIAKRMRSHQRITNLITNGAILTEREIERAKKADISGVAVSLDGMSATHDSIRRVPGSFDKVLRALDLLTQAEISTGAVTSVSKRNIHELKDIYSLLRQHKVKVWQLQLVEPMGNMAGQHDVIVTPKEIGDILDFLASVANNGSLRIDVGDNIGYYSKYEQTIRAANSTSQKSNINFWIGCMAGVQVVGIRSNGDVTGCLSIRDDSFVEGNLRKRSLKEIWNDPEFCKFTRGFETRMLKGHCADCTYGEVCRGGCTAMAVASSGHVCENRLCFAHGVSS